MADLERNDQETLSTGEQPGKNIQPEWTAASQLGTTSQPGATSQPGGTSQPDAATAPPQGWTAQPPQVQPGHYAPPGWGMPGPGGYQQPGWPAPGQEAPRAAHGARNGGYPAPSMQWAPYPTQYTAQTPYTAQAPYVGQAPYAAQAPYAGQGSTRMGQPGAAPDTNRSAASRQAPGEAGSDRYEDLKTAPFYNEKYRKPGKGRMKGLVGPMIAIGLICSILGSAATGAVLYAYRSDLFASVAPTQGGQAAPVGDNTVRKVEILNRTDEPITAIAEKAGPSVVGINVEYTYNDSFFGTQQGGGQGSGIIISSDGYILTNNHVVEAAANTGSSRSRFSNTGRITVVLPSHPDEPYEATIIGLDAKTDIAVIKIDAQNLPVADIGDSDALVVGELAVAIGNPAGLEYMGSVTSGIISGLNRRVDTGDGNMLRLIQTDAAISPGNSGGALLNAEGQVVGVNSSKIGGTSYEGLGFAIPIKDAMNIANSLMEDGFVVRPQIGVNIDNTFTAEVAKANKVPKGVLVGSVLEGSPADEAGIKQYDIITAFNGVAVTSFNELEEQKNKFNPGDEVKLTVYRIPEGAQPASGESLDVTLTLGSTANSK